MGENSYISIRNATIASIIAGVILLAMPVLRGYFVSFLSWAWSGVVWCFCPRCDATLVYDDSSCRSLYSDVNKTDFICENCGRNIVASISGGKIDYATGALEREISRRIRAGEYTKH
jgi:predicted RNA-binding Zn-ribbon protein involved in translation (DUF1610 family)